MYNVCRRVIVVDWGQIEPSVSQLQCSLPFIFLMSVSSPMVSNVRNESYFKLKPLTNGIFSLDSNAKTAVVGVGARVWLVLSTPIRAEKRLQNSGYEYTY